MTGRERRPPAPPGPNSNPSANSNGYSGYNGSSGYAATSYAPDRQRAPAAQHAPYTTYGGYDESQSPPQNPGPRQQQPAATPSRPNPYAIDQQQQAPPRPPRAPRDRPPVIAAARRQQQGYGPGTRKLDDVLRVVERQWEFMTGEQCVPVKVALDLMDTSSLGMADQYQAFRETHEELQHALQAIVNDHHQGFNSSIGTFHSIMRSITTSQSKVRELRESLLKAREDLSSSKPEVRNMVESSQAYEAMLATLQRMEHLERVPEKLEAKISEKRFLTAVELLGEALKTIRQPDMMEIGALSDLRTYLGSQESSLADILLEELHNHLYLKSLYCNDRWKAYTTGQKEAVVLANLSAENSGYGANHQRALLKFLDSNDFAAPMVDDTDSTKNPETDSLSYIRLVLEALHNLGHLSNAIAMVNQRLPVELFKLVDKTNNEVAQRHPSSMAPVSRNNKSIDLGMGENDLRIKVMNDLLCTLYSKFEAVMEGHRVIFDVVKGISKRESLEDTAAWSNGFMEVWQLIQSEMRSLLHDYLTTSESRGMFTAGVPKSMHNAIANIVAGKALRDPNRSLFKLANIDSAGATLKEDQEDLQYILKASVPGLVSESLRPAVSSTEHNTVSDGAATGHRLLIEPSVFNISLLLPPSLSFLNRLKEVVPVGSGIVLSTLPSFLDDFLVNVFFPSLEDTIRDLFAQTTGDLDAFQEDPNWTQISKKPVMKGTTAFLDLITAFCKMLDTLPPDQAFGQLTIDLLTSYYDKCYEWYKDLVSRIGAGEDEEANADMKLSARLAQNEVVRRAMNKLYADEGKTSPEELYKLETDAELAHKGSDPIAATDLITDRKAIHSLCILSTSMKWIASKVVQLRHIEGAERFSRNDGGNSGRLRRRWTLIDALRLNDEGRPIYLPMTTETVGAFDGVVSSFQELSTTILFTLRAEARTRTVHYLYKSLAEGNYCLESTVTTPDIHILALNSDLCWFDEDISTALGPTETSFILCGLGHLMDHLLISWASLIKLLNRAGAARMRTNILVLQQNLKNIEKSSDLGRAARFYGLYETGMKKIIEDAKKGEIEFGFDELKVIVELYYSEAMNNRRESAAALQARRSLNEGLLQLSEIMWTL